jgi:hypothetical protein
MATKLSWSEGHAFRLRGVKFQESLLFEAEMQTKWQFE